MKFSTFLIVIVAAVAAYLYFHPEQRGALLLPGGAKPRPSLAARLEPMVMQMSKATEFSKTPTEPPPKSEILALQQELKAELPSADATRRGILLRAGRTCDVMLEMWAQYEALIGSAVDSRSKPSANRGFFSRAILQRWWDYNSGANVRLQTALAELKAAEQAAP